MKYKPKSFVGPTIYLLVLFVITGGVYFTKKTYDNYEKNVESGDYGNITFVSSSIFDRSIPVVNVKETLRNPFEVDDIEIMRYYYNKNDDTAKKEKSVVYYEDTYMPNTGVDYSYKEEFNVLSIYDGTVIDVLDDELLGKTVKVRHNNDIISVYQGLGSIDVNKGDMVFNGSKIGTSGTNKINQNNNSLHFEIYKNGEAIDPLTCIDKKLGDI